MCSRGGRRAALLRLATRQPDRCGSRRAARRPGTAGSFGRRGTPTDFGPAANFARATALSMPSVTNWTVEPGRGQPSGTWWVTTKAGTSHGCWPPQPSARSNVRRPVSMAPTSATKPLRWSALGAETVERHSRFAARCGDLDVAREVPVENLGDPVVRVGDVPVERHRHQCDNLAHPLVLLRSCSAFLRDSAGMPKSSVNPLAQPEAVSQAPSARSA